MYESRACAGQHPLHLGNTPARRHTGFYASSIKYDGAQFQKMEGLLAERVRPYVDQHYWLPLYSMGAFAQRKAELGYRPTVSNPGRLGAMREPLPCWSAFTEGYVTAEGNSSPTGRG